MKISIRTVGDSFGETLEVPVAIVYGNFFELKRQFILNRVINLIEITNIIYEVTL